MKNKHASPFFNAFPFRLTFWVTLLVLHYAPVLSNNCILSVSDVSNKQRCYSFLIRGLENDLPRAHVNMHFLRSFGPRVLKNNVKLKSVSSVGTEGILVYTTRRARGKKNRRVRNQFTNIFFWI